MFREAVDTRSQASEFVVDGKVPLNRTGQDLDRLLAEETLQLGNPERAVRFQNPPDGAASVRVRAGFAIFAPSVEGHVILAGTFRCRHPASSPADSAPAQIADP